MTFLFYLIGIALLIVATLTIGFWPRMSGSQPPGAERWPRWIYLCCGLLGAIGFWSEYCFSSRIQLQPGAVRQLSLRYALPAALALLLWGAWCLRAHPHRKFYLLELLLSGSLGLHLGSLWLVRTLNQTLAQGPAEIIELSKVRPFVTIGAKGGHTLKLLFESDHPLIAPLSPLRMTDDNWDRLMAAIGTRTDGTASLYLRPGAFGLPWVENIGP